MAYRLLGGARLPGFPRRPLLSKTASLTADQPARNQAKLTAGRARDAKWISKICLSEKSHQKL